MTDMKDIKIDGDYITLHALLKLSGLCSTGGEAKIHIDQSEVLVNGEVCLQRAKKIREGYTVSFDGVTLLVKR